MLDLVLHGAAVPLPGIAPVVFRDELLVGARLQGSGLPDRPRAQLSVEPESVGDPLVEPVPHRQRHVVLVVGQPGDGGDGPLGDQLLHEDDPALVPTTHIEAQVELLEVPVEGHGDPLQPGVQEEEAHQRAPVVADVRVEHGPSRYQRLEQLRIHAVVEHDQVAPLGGQEAQSRLLPLWLTTSESEYWRR